MTNTHCQFTALNDFILFLPKESLPTPVLTCFSTGLGS